MKQPAIQIPEGCHEVLLHACCAPCSSAIVEWLLAHGVKPTIFYFNPNIWPRDEYEIRKHESKRHAESLGVRWIDGDYDHEAWRNDICGLENEPERGRRCQRCFTLRLSATAKMAQELGFTFFTTTLASSRWKSLEQIAEAGMQAAQIVPNVTFWAQNWRKGGLQERRNQLLCDNAFYNQQYCGCEFSVPHGAPTKAALRQFIRDAKQRHIGLMAQWSKAIAGHLADRLSSAQIVMAYWPLADEVDIRGLLSTLVTSGKTVLLPQVVDDTTMQLCRFTSVSNLSEGAFHVMEPIGGVFTDYQQIDVALIPGVAFDASGHRLGRGCGYYDRFLSAHSYIYKIGVCFPFQRVAEVPTEAHDVKMDEL